MVSIGFAAADISFCAPSDRRFRRSLGATCMAIVEKKKRIVIISIDFPELRRSLCARLEKEIGAAIGTLPEYILIHTQDTHTGPKSSKIAEERRFVRLSKSLSEIALQAVDKARPARMRCGKTDVGRRLSLQRRGNAGPDLGVQTFWYGYQFHSGNDRPDASALVSEMKQRWFGLDPVYEPGPEPIWFDRPVDPLVQAMSFEDESGNPLGSVVRFSAHAHLALFCQEQAWDPDYPARVQDIMQEEIGGPCLFLLGPSGNLVPAERVRYFLDPKRMNIADSPFGPTGALVAVDDNELLAEIDRIGHQIGEAAIVALHSAPVHPVDKIRFFSEPFSVPLDPCLPSSPEEVERMKDILWPEVEALRRRGGPLRELRRLANRINWLTWTKSCLWEWYLPSDEERARGEIVFPISALALGQSIMTFSPAETTVENTLALREATPGIDLWVISLIGGSIAYFPTAEQIDEGGYEGRCTLVRRDAEEQLRTRILALVNNIAN